MSKSVQTRSRARKDPIKEDKQVSDNCPMVFDDNVSCPGSRSNVSKCSSGSTSRATLALAKLKEQQLVKRLELERKLKLQEARDEIELAELQVALSEVEETEDWQTTGEKAAEKEKSIKRYLDDCCKNNKENDKSVPSPSMSNLRLELPKVELSCFYGNECDYWKFIRQFDYFVESKIDDPGQRLLYLLNYCKGKARVAIEECIMLPPDIAYQKAREILRDLFGQPHIVARSVINSLMDIPAMRVSDAEALTMMSMKLRNSEIALRQMNYHSDLDAIHTIEMLVMKLPLDLRDKWSRDVDKIYGMGREPKFGDLTQFVSGEARISRSRFGKLARGKYAQPDHVQTSSSRSRAIFNTMNVANDEVKGGQAALKCTLCMGRHTIEKCYKYLAMKVSDRWECLKKLKVCFVCLSSGHRAQACDNKRICDVESCKRTHHPTLHQPSEGNAIENDEAPKICAATHTNNERVHLGVIPVLVRGPNGTITTYALLDNGSDTTLIKNELVRQLGVQCQQSEIRIRTVTSSTIMKSSRCSLEISPVDRSETVNVSEAYAIENLPTEIVGVSAATVSKQWSHLKDLTFPEAEPGKVGILIGCDVPEAHWVLDQRIGARGQPFAVKTMLGWVIYGPSSKTVDGASVRCTMVDKASVWECLQAMYNQEFCDIHSTDSSLSQEEKRAIEIVSNSTRYLDGHFEVPLPWREGASLSDNRNYALQRLIQLRRRFSRQKGLFEKYGAVIREHLDKGYVAKVERTLVHQRGARVWYLPHHPVFHPKKPDKVRIVFDCAARYREKSLNDCLYQGPDTTSNLVGILLRFRKHPIALVADIEEMFLQVKVTREDREALRFLWWAGDDMFADPEHYQLTVHPFGATSSPFCANFALRKAVTEFGADLDEDTKRMMKQDFYVDDCIASVENVEKGVDVIEKVVNVFRKAGFRLRKWMSNNRKVLENVPESELADRSVKLKGHALPTERTLGLEWDAEADVFKFQFECEAKVVTRRGILASVSTLFDPLGFVAPLILPAKMLLQELCRSRLGWDEPLDQNASTKWQEWVTSMRRMKTISLPRCVRGPEADIERSSQLHIFCDASEKGYGAVAYVRNALAGSCFDSRILLAKARVAPIKTVTIPRLELTAAVLGVRLLKCVQSEMQMAFESIYLWTDSIIVLRYITNSKSRFCTFVANRLQEIHESTTPSQWRHVGSKQNPADYASRGAMWSDQQLDMWLRGPPFLNKSMESWPVQETWESDETGLELKKSIANHLITREPRAIDKLLCRYSCWLKLLRAVVWLTRFKTYLLVMKGRVNRLKVGQPDVDEISQAELDVIRMAQKDCFRAEYDVLEKNEPAGNRAVWRTSTLRRLCPVMEDGVLRVQGRVSSASVAGNCRRPIILPKSHAVTVAIVSHYHEREGHSGVSHVLGAIRQKYWVVNGGAVVKNVIGRCILCRKLNAVPGKQMMAPLPVERVEEGWHPFRYVGVDYFGPFMVKRGRVLEKRYGCLFTCLQCRAIHVEVAHSMTTDSFIMALMRFISRRGKPDEVFSDNGSNFVGADTELKKDLQGLLQERINRTMVDNGIKWNFHPPIASHRGGVWERMIRSVRRVLNSTVGTQTLTDETLTSFLCQAERIINDRPLLPLRDAIDELKPLRPSDLLHPMGEGSVNIEVNLERLATKRWKTVKYLTSVFWKRWMSEYLPTLQLRQKWMSPHRNFAVGDLVLVVSDSLPKGQWPLGIVEETNEDGDGMVRTLKVRTTYGVLVRDIRKVCLIEGVG